MQTQGVRYFIGLDLGQAQEYTALALLEQADDAVKQYSVRHLKRWPLGTGFPVILEDTTRLIDALDSRPMLAVDVTAVGRPVVRLVHQAKLGGAVYAITVTAGHGVVGGPDGPLVPKKELVSTMQVLLQARRLKIAQSLPEAKILAEELAAFRARVSTRANDPLGDWREHPHDDLVLGVAMAVWLAESRIEPYTGPLLCWPEADPVGTHTGGHSLMQEVLDRMDREEEVGNQWWS